MTVFGITGAFELPAAAALLPAAAPRGALQRAMALTTAAGQAAVICGPALGGFAYAAAAWLPYALMAVFWVAAGVLTAMIRLEREVSARGPRRGSPRSSPGWASCGAIRRSWGRSRSISSRCCSGVLRR